ncbi:MAG: radical SAM protein [Rhodospirillales bacterium]
MTALPTPLPVIEKPAIDPRKFRDPFITAKGETRASVGLRALRTLWFNTGSLCNITCVGCYMESSPKNDRLAYITQTEVAAYLDEIEADEWPVEEIGFTGGEPFMNRDLPAILDDVLSRGFRALVLTNAMKPMWHKREALKTLNARHGDRLTLRVSIDHHTQAGHEAIRGENTWTPMIKGVRWLTENGFDLAIAGRTLWNEPEAEARAAYAAMLAGKGISLDTADPSRLVLFPEMDETHDVPEITTACWDILSVDPDTVMCATSRMVIKRKGADAPAVVPCTLLPYDEKFELGESLADADTAIQLNHPHCAKFCVLGGASCSG